MEKKKTLIVSNHELPHIFNFKMEIENKNFEFKFFTYEDINNPFCIYSLDLNKITQICNAYKIYVFNVFFEINEGGIEPLYISIGNKKLEKRYFILKDNTIKKYEDNIRDEIIRINDEKKSEYLLLKKELNKKKIEILNLNKKLSEYMITEKEKEILISELNEKLKTCLEEKNEINNQIKIKNNEMKELCDKFFAVQNKNIKNKNILENKEKELSELKEKIKSMEKTYETEIENYKSLMSSLKKENNIYRDLLNLKEKEIENLNKIMIENKKELTKFKSE